MTIDKNYFMSRLANGESMDAIGEEIAALMTEALNEHNAQVEAAKQAEVEKEATKRDLVEEMCEILKELAILEGIDPDAIEISDELIDQMVAGITASFQLAKYLEDTLGDGKVVASVPKTRSATINVKPTDDQILADFIKMFN